MLRRICKWVVFKWMYPAIYFLGSLRRIYTKKIIFVETHAECLSDNYELLYNRLRQNGYDINVHYLKVASSKWTNIVIRTSRLIWDMATARCIFLNESNSAFGSFSLRRGTKLVQLWHACGAFKKWGYSVSDKSFGDDKRTLDVYSGHRNYNLVPVSGEAVCWAYEEAFGLQGKPDVVRPLGVSRTDVYFDEERKQKAYAELSKLDLKIKGRKVILYAPTFRGEIRHAKAPDRLDLPTMYRLQEEYVILVKQHPFIRERMEIPEQYRDFCMEVTDQMSIEELLMTADICITDYSSIVFEYSLMERPILFFAYDLDGYYDERGFYYPYESFVPGPVVRTTEELADAVEQIDEFNMEKLQVFRQQYMSGCDGHSTERILENVFGRKL